ncbi:MAG: hypothetical protein R2710_21165, partial [Acidimicrobiales bacterium]
MPPREGHLLWCEPPKGTHFGEDERKVLVWSKNEWTEIDRVGIEGLDGTRFISGTTQTPLGPLRVIGVCIPWHMAEVSYPTGEKRKPWELHIHFLGRLEELIGGFDGPTVIAGDFNQQVPRVSYGRKDAAAALTRAFAPLDVVTSGHIEGGRGPGIDHIAISRDLTARRVWGWANDVTGARLS